MNNGRIQMWVAALLIAAVISPPASATLVGDQVDVALRATGTFIADSGTSDPVVAGSGPELTLDSGSESFWFLDFEASQIVITSDVRGAGVKFINARAAFEFSSLDWIGAPSGRLIGATVSETGGNDGFFLSIDNLGDHAFDLKIGGYNWTDSSVVTIDLVTDHGGSAVSEPLTASLVALGLAVLGYTTKRRRV